METKEWRLVAFYSNFSYLHRAQKWTAGQVNASRPHLIVMHSVFVVLGYQTSDKLLQAISISAFFLLKAGFTFKKRRNMFYSKC